MEANVIVTRRGGGQRAPAYAKPLPTVSSLFPLDDAGTIKFNWIP